MFHQLSVRDPGAHSDAIKYESFDNVSHSNGCFSLLVDSNPEWFTRVHVSCVYWRNDNGLNQVICLHCEIHCFFSLKVQCLSFMLSEQTDFTQSGKKHPWCTWGSWCGWSQFLSSQTKWCISHFSRRSEDTPACSESRNKSRDILEPVIQHV